MTATAFHSQTQETAAPRPRDALAAFAAASFLLLVYGAGGFETLSDLGGDNDSLLRLVEIRDLLGGQGWFDLMQYRMGPEGGFAMHWSRLVDAPIALIILVATGLTGSAAMGETVALVFWPFLLSALCLFFLLRAARRYGGEPATLPALALGAAALHFTGVFRPAALDHHNVQLTLFFAMVMLLLERGRTRGISAGAAAALMLAVGMETLPHVAVGGLVAALLFLSCHRRDILTAQGFGTGFAAVASVAFMATIPPSRWSVVACDAYSVAQFAVAAIAGVGLAAMSSSRWIAATRSRRLSALALLGVLVIALVLAAFPQCLADPYATLDPRLKTFWLSMVTEAQPLWKLAVDHPAMAISQYGSPLFALAVMFAVLIRRGWRADDMIIAGLLVVAFLVSAWQVRGSNFAISLAVLPLSAWVGRARRHAAQHPGAVASLALVMAWLLSFNASWASAGIGLRMFSGGSAEAGLPAETDACTGADDYSDLAAMPPVRLLAISNLGAPILRYTGHNVFAGPYHRNVAGNLIALDAFTGPLTDTEKIVRSHKVGMVAMCRGNSETTMLAERAPGSLAAALLAGNPPAWLQPVPVPAAKSIELYRVVPLPDR